ncbi:MAG TPA: hypothetical protein VF151_10935 [Gemmatimonadales bacterium]
MRRIRHILLLAALALPACSSTPVQPRTETVEVKVPVPVACLDASQLPKAPVLQSKTALASLDDYNLVLEIAAEREELIAYAGELEALLSVCAATPTAQGRPTPAVLR